MSGNPYTESGEAFEIPDMLANRADIYNLGDVLGGKEAVFNISYIENGLTSIQSLANPKPPQQSLTHHRLNSCNRYWRYWHDHNKMSVV